MSSSRIVVSLIIFLLLVGGLVVLNRLAARPKPPPDVQLEGRLAPEPPAAVANEEALASVSNAEETSNIEASEAPTKGQQEPGQGESGAAQPASDTEKAIIAKAKGSVVKLETDRGDIYLELYDEKVPITVGNFLDLVNSKFYDGLTFHRVIPNFMIQGGDPKGDGTGGPGWTIPDEIDKSLKHVRGTLSMAKTAAPNTGGSQFFICHSPQPHLDGKHAVFGECVKGMDVVDQIEPRDKIKKAVILKRSEFAREAIEKAKQARKMD